MILVDDRAGSKELVRYLSQPHSLARLTAGDAAFTGEGADGEPVSVGIEHKTISDLCSCIDNGRFAGTQLPGLLAEYDYPYLMVEGVWRSDPESGVLQTRKGKGWSGMQYGQRSWMYSEVMGWLNTMSVVCGIRIIFTGSKTDSGRVISNLYSWWGKPWDRHTAHLQLDLSRMGARKRKEVELVPPTLVRRVAVALPGVGWGKSKEIEDEFHSVREMCEADEKRWMKVKGIGKKLARAIVGELMGEHE